MSHTPDAPSPEHALAAYQQAHAEGNVEAAVAAIDFRLEAQQLLKAKHPSGGELDEDQVKKLAAAREAEYRSLLATRGFGKGLDVANCTVVSKLENTPTQHTFVLRGASAPNAVNIFPLAFSLTSQGWRLVRSA